MAFFLGSVGMIKNYLLFTFRNLWKNKGYSFLNIFGLAIGIACAGLIFLWMEDEFNYDSTYAKKDLLYKVRTNQTYAGKKRTFDSTPGGLAPAMKAEIPGVVNACRFGWGGSPLFSLGNKSINESGVDADSTVFSMFTFQFIQGDARDAFRQLNSVVISQKMAKQFFGNEEKVVGKLLKVDNKEDFLVTGVIKDMPENSTLHFEWFSPFEIFQKKNDWLKYWGANGVTTYTELSPNANIAAVRRQLDGFLVKKSGSVDIAHPILFSMNDWHLRDHFEDGVQIPGGRITYVHLFSIIAWIIILIACINFMNLATARSEKRAREVGVRKVLGAGRKMLIGQFIGEALFMSALAVITGLCLIIMVLPAFNTLVEKNLVTGLDQPMHVLSLLAIGLFCGLVAGSYPALYLSAFNPVSVLKGIKNPGGSADWIRKGLVVLQFTVAIVLIIATVITYQQVQHVKTRDLGYNKDNLIKSNLQGNMLTHFSAIRQDLLNTGLIENAALSSNEIIYTSDNTTGYEWEGKDPNKKVLISYRLVSPGFMQTWGMRVVEGRDFQSNALADSSNVIITESFEKLIGKGSAVGKLIKDGTDNYRVTGVIKDLVYGDMYGKGDPVVFFCAPNQTFMMYTRIKKEAHPEEALAKIESVLKADNPGYPFNYQFVDDQFNEFFKSEALIEKLSRVFASLTIFISCLGLFGLAAYTAERRTREIGIRKVLGASTTGIIGLLSKDFLKLVFVSALIAFPIAWYAMHSWLNNYAYRVEINGWIFVVAGAAAILIALTTISYQAIRTAMANPVTSLRSE
jgi:putative ABC transport system permease protein